MQWKQGRNISINSFIYMLGAFGILTFIFVVAQCLFNCFENTKTIKYILTGILLGISSFIFNYYYYEIGGSAVFDMRFMLIAFAGIFYNKYALISLTPFYLLSVYLSPFSMLYALLAIFVAFISITVNISKSYRAVLYIFCLVPIVFSEATIEGYLPPYNAKVIIVIAVGVALLAALCIGLLSVFMGRGLVTSFFFRAYLIETFGHYKNIYPVSIDKTKTVVRLTSKCVNDFEFDDTVVSYESFTNLLKTCSDGALTPINRKVVRAVFVTHGTGIQKYVEYACTRRLFGGYKGLFRDITNDESRYGLLSKAAERDYVTGFKTYNVIKETLPEIVAVEDKGSVILLNVNLNLNRTQQTIYEVETEIISYRYIASLLKLKFPKYHFFSVKNGEFVILINKIERDADIQDYIKSINEVLIKSHKIGDISLFISTKIGGFSIERKKISTHKQSSIALDKLSFCKYMLMQNNNYNTYIFSQKEYEEYKNRIKRLRYLPNIIAQKDFKIVYQPIVDIKSKNVKLYEALLRVNNSFYNNTGTFVEDAIAEGYDVELDKMIISRILQDIKEGIVQTSISINLLGNTPIFDEIIEIAQLLKDKGNFLYLEITEYMKLDYEKVASKMIFAKKNGIKIVSDDFGSGFSTNEAVMALDFDMLKITKNIVEKLNLDTKKQKMVQSIVSFCNEMGIECVAEGVESEEEFNSLSSINVNLIQGYYFKNICAKALPLSIKQLKE